MSGKDNIVADALSRTDAPTQTHPSTLVGSWQGVGGSHEPEDTTEETPGFLCNAVLPGIDYQELANAQARNPDVQA